MKNLSVVGVGHIVVLGYLAGVLVLVHGTAEVVAQAKAILGTANPLSLDVHSNAATAQPLKVRR